MNDVREYYISLWGKPSRAENFYAAGVRTRVLKWEPSATDEGVALYATVGASEGRRGSVHRVEFVVGLLPAEDGVMRSLGGLGAFPRVSGIVNKGDTISLGAPLWPGTDMKAFLVVPEIDEFLPTLKLRNYHVEFLRVLPIYDSELQMKKEHGPGWLMERLHDQHIRMSSPQRLAVLPPSRGAS